MEDGIRNICQSDPELEKELKAGLMVAIRFLIRMSTKILAADFIIRQQKEKSHDIEILFKYVHVSAVSGRMMDGVSNFV